jgi:ankyrin repeat protein
MKIIFIPTFCLGIAMQCAGINQAMTSDSKTDGLPIGTETNPLNAALLKAAEQGDEKAVKLLLQQGANVDAQNSKGWTPLIFAGLAGNKNIVHALIEKGADVNRKSTTETGSTALCFAVEGGSLEAVKDLLDHGANVNGKSTNGMTPLGYAAIHGKIKEAKFLIANGADVNLLGLVDSRGAEWSPLTSAAKEDHLDMLELLLSNGANLEATNNEGDTALMITAKRPRPKSIKFFISKGARVNARGPRGHTALIYAAYNGMTENLKLLLSSGADPFATATDSNKPGGSRYGAVHLAKQQGHPEVLALIREAQTKLRLPTQR